MMQALTPWLAGAGLLLTLYAALSLLSLLSWGARPSLRLQSSLRQNRLGHHLSQPIRRRRR